MAGDIPNLNVEVLVQLSNLTAAVNQATEGLNKIGNAAKAQESKFGSLKTTMAGVFAGNILAEGINKVVEGLKGMGDAVIKTQAAQANLQTAVKDAGQNFAAATPVVEKYAKTMVNLGFTHDQTYASIAKLTAATGSVVTATNAMNVVADLARFKQISLADAADLLARSTAGGARGLADLGIKLGVTIPKGASFAEILKTVEDRAHGAADAFAGTLGGQLDITKAKFDDMQVALGEKLIPTITKLANWINGTLFPALEKFGKVLSDLKTPLEFITGAMIAIFAAPKIDALLAAIRSIAVAWGLVAKSAEEAAAAEAAAGARGAVAGLVRAVVANPITAMVGVAAATGYGFYKAGTDQGPPQKPVTGGAGYGAAMALYKERLAAYNASQPKQNMFAYEYQNTENSAGAIGGGRTPVNVAAAAAAAKAAADRQAKIKAQMDALQKVAKDALDKTAVAERDNAQQVAVIRRDNAQRVETIERDHQQQLTKLDRDYKQQQNSILDTYNTNKLNAEKTAADKLVTLQKDTAQKIADAQQAAADQQVAITQQSIDLMRNAFSNVAGYDIGTNFANGISGGFTVGAGDLVKQMQDHLKSIQQLQDDAGKLAGLGYTQTFIDQVIAQGPKIGDQLAQALMKADPTTTGTLQDLYANIQNTSNHGLDQLATSMNQGGQLATEQLTASYTKVGTDLKAALDKVASDSKDAEAQIQTDLQTTLTQLAKDRDKSMADALQSYQNQMADMDTSYKNQLADAAQALTNSLADAATALNNKLADIMKSMLDSLMTINSALAGLGVGGAAGGAGYTTKMPIGAITSAPLTYTTSSGFKVPNTSPQGPGITFNQTNHIASPTPITDIQNSTISGLTLGAPLVLQSAGVNNGIAYTDLATD
jgi:hypothetical protein